MNKNPNNRIFGMTQNELIILITMGGLLLCVIILFGGYIIYNLNRSGPVAVIPPTSMPQPVIQPTNPPLPIQSPNNPVPQPTFTSAPTNISAPTTSSKFGTFNNPVPIGIGYTFPGFGTLTVIKFSWLSVKQDLPS